MLGAKQIRAQHGYALHGDIPGIQWSNDGEQCPPPLNGRSRCFTDGAVSNIRVAATTSWSFQVNKDTSFSPNRL
jgi:hypothetical protein